MKSFGTGTNHGAFGPGGGLWEESFVPETLVSHEGSVRAGRGRKQTDGRVISLRCVQEPLSQAFLAKHHWVVTMAQYARVKVFARQQPGCDHSCRTVSTEHPR